MSVQLKNQFFLNAYALNIEDGGGVVWTFDPATNTLSAAVSGSSLGGVVPAVSGGTGFASYAAGDMLYANTTTSLAKLTVGSAGSILKVSGGAPAWAAPAALTKTDDTNVVLTLGGSPSTALVNAASLTLSWSGTLAAPRGGTGFGSYAAGDLLYANSGSSLAKLPVGTAGDILRVSGGAPAWQAPSALPIGWGQLTGVPASFVPAPHMEEGNWTPVDDSGAGLTLTVSSARFFRHENLCFAMADIVYPATASGADARISGLPFPVAAGNANRQGFVSYHSSALGQLFLVPNSGTTTFNWYKPGGGAASNADLSGAQVFFCAVFGCVP